MKYNVKLSLEKRADKTKPVLIDGKPLIINGKPVFELITNNVPLFADIRFSGTRMFYFTGYRIDANKYNPETEEAEGKGREGFKVVGQTEINRRLKKIKATLLLFFENRQTTTTKEITAELDTIIGKTKKQPKEEEAPTRQGFIELFEQYIKDAKISEVRKRNINSTLNHWKEYSKAIRKEITFDLMTVETLKKFEAFLRNGSKAAKGVNTIHKTMAMTRTFLNYVRPILKNAGIEAPYPFGNDGYSIPAEVYGTPIYITKAERDMLFTSTLQSEKLSKVRDIFVFQCLTGCRLGDLKKLTSSNIVNNTINYIANKTVTENPITITVPLNPQAREILSRYDIPDGRILPFFSDAKYNEYIKELFEVTGLTRNVSRINPTTGKPEKVRICDIASSHMARRAFIGNLYGKVDNSIISSMSGHTKGSKAFARYYDVSKELQEQAINLL